MKKLLLLLVPLLLSGCGLLLGVAAFGVIVGTPDSSGLIRFEQSPYVRYFFGAGWVKKDMTRESRKADWVACGGEANLKLVVERQNKLNPYESSESAEMYWERRYLRSKDIWACMHAKHYRYFGEGVMTGYGNRHPELPGAQHRCDERCFLF